MDTTYYLFGSTAGNLYYDAGVDGIIESGCDFGLFKFVEGETKSWALIDAYDGWGEYTVISEKEFNQLSNVYSD